MRHFMRAMQTGNLVMMWFSTAMLDGKITVMEMAELIQGIARIWKIRIHLDLSGITNHNIMSELVPDDMADFEAARADFEA